MNIFRSSLTLGIVLSLVGQVHAQTTSTAKARYAAVNKALPGCRVIKRDLSGYSTEGGQLIAYVKDGQARKIVARYYGESGRATEEYYFWRGSLFFALRSDWQYQYHLNDPNGKAPGKEKRFQERFYFEKGKLVNWIGEGGKSNDLTTTAALKSERDFLQSARDLLAKVKG